MSEIKDFKKILDDHEKRISQLEKHRVSIPVSKKHNTGKTSIMDLILEVKGEGFFDKPRFLGDIINKFEEMGHIYDRRSVTNPLSRALKSRILGRKKIDGKWGYVKR